MIDSQYAAFASVDRTDVLLESHRHLIRSGVLLKVTAQLYDTKSVCLLKENWCGSMGLLEPDQMQT